MDKFVIRGGKKLKGKFTVEGAKNAALPIIAGTLLLKRGESVLRNIPPLRDINTIIAMLEHIGARVEFDREARTMTVNAENLTNNTAPYEMMNKMRASFLVLGPILQRMGEAVISLPGGCSLGPRPVDYHIKGFQALGAEITEKAKEEANRIKKKTELDIQKAKEEALLDIRNEVLNLSTNVASKILQRNLNAEDQTKIVDQVLTEVGKKS